jgi:ABC-type Fe3+/spermidine/putrescine transport system ATPase subunit
MQLELKTIQRELEITFVFVTHDQEESLTLSDRIAVMNNGRLEQVGTPAQVYEHPRNAFAAGFIGASNLLACEITDGRAQPPGLPSFALPGGERRWRDGERVVVSIRPEKLVVSKTSDRAEPSGAASPASTDGNAESVGPGGGLGAVVSGVVYLGATTQLELRAANTATLRAVSFRPSGSAGREWRVGDQVEIRWDPADARVFREDTGSEAADAAEGSAPQPAPARFAVQGRTRP